MNKFLKNLKGKAIEEAEKPAEPVDQEKIEEELQEDNFFINVMDLPATKEITDLHSEAQGLLNFEEENLQNCYLLKSKMLSMLQLSC